MQRRLTTILAADVVGYSRLMAADETGTLAALKTHRRELVAPKTDEYGGRTVKLMGDGTLMEFASVVDAVRFAVDVQRTMVVRNAAVPENRRIIYRMGINIGDIIVDGDDIYGEGVNVAARLEALSEPGGICVSRTVFNHVQGKVDTAFEDLGAREVKNIPKPVQVYRVLLEDIADARPDFEARSEALALPDKPSIAVLPFDNMSGDPEQEYLADGITEDLITALSKIRWFFVIARNSTYTYKGEAVEVTQVAKDLGVRYVLEGSVRKAGNRVRVTAQLIDATIGRHVWAERYDREIEDIFDLQDEMSQTIVGAVEPELSRVEQDRARRKRPEDLNAWDCYLRGMWHVWRSSKVDNEEAQR
ncbi:MAG: adenylate/guanylate cyclase domain-containing protein, partial [Kiloniellales bacterium]